MEARWQLWMVNRVVWCTAVLRETSVLFLGLFHWHLMISLYLGLLSSAHSCGCFHYHSHELYWNILQGRSDFGQLTTSGRVVLQRVMHRQSHSWAQEQEQSRVFFHKASLLYKHSFTLKAAPLILIRPHLRGKQHITHKCGQWHNGVIFKQNEKQV